MDKSGAEDKPKRGRWERRNFWWESRFEYFDQTGAQAIQDYVVHERDQDAAWWSSPALFLAAATVPQGTGRLTVGVVNTVWNAVCRIAQVQGRTPHSARHAMGKHIIAKTGNIAAVQKQLGHRQAAYAMQYARTTTEELAQVLDDR